MVSLGKHVLLNVILNGFLKEKHVLLNVILLGKTGVAKCRLQ